MNKRLRSKKFSEVSGFGTFRFRGGPPKGYEDVSLSPGEVWLEIINDLSWDRGVPKIDRQYYVLRVSEIIKALKEVGQ